MAKNNRLCTISIRSISHRARRISWRPVTTFVPRSYRPKIATSREIWRRSNRMIIAVCHNSPPYNWRASLQRRGKNGMIAETTYRNHLSQSATSCGSLIWMTRPGSIACISQAWRRKISWFKAKTNLRSLQARIIRMASIIAIARPQISSLKRTNSSWDSTQPWIWILSDLEALRSSGLRWVRHREMRARPLRCQNERSRT